jgi:GxxExxY protein
LGPGLLESVYESAVAVELEHQGVLFKRQAKFPVYYRGVLIGTYFADFCVDGKIILELKSVKCLLPVMKAQLINYLRISGIQVGYLFNFNAESLKRERIVLSR